MRRGRAASPAGGRAAKPGIRDPGLTRVRGRHCPPGCGQDCHLGAWALAVLQSRSVPQAAVGGLSLPGMAATAGRGLARFPVFPAAGIRHCSGWGRVLPRAGWSVPRMGGPHQVCKGAVTRAAWHGPGHTTGFGARTIRVGRCLRDDGDGTGACMAGRLFRAGLPDGDSLGSEATGLPSGRGVRRCRCAPLLTESACGAACAVACDRWPGCVGVLACPAAIRGTPACRACRRRGASLGPGLRGVGDAAPPDAGRAPRQLVLVTVQQFQRCVPKTRDLSSRLRHAVRLGTAMRPAPRARMVAQPGATTP